MTGNCKIILLYDRHRDGNSKLSRQITGYHCPSKLKLTKIYENLSTVIKFERTV